jgi:integrase
MRLSHHLTLIGSTWYFRLTTPPDLRAFYGRRYLKHSLHTSDVRTAKILAYHLSAAYLDHFTRLRGEKMAGRGPSGSISKFELIPAYDKDGKPAGWAYQANGAADDRRGREEVARLKREGLRPGPAPGELVFNMGSSGPAVPRKLLSEAIDWFQTKYAGGIAAGGKSEDELKRAKKLQGKFLAFLGGDPPVNDIGRAEIDGFRSHMALAPSTVRNKLSYLRQLFEDLKAAGYYSGANPAEGHVKLSSRQKQARSKAHGREPFSEADIAKIFDPKAYARNSEPAEYFVPLIQLYTGARVNEVCQLRVNDFVVVDGHECFVVMDSDPDQSVKDGSSKRTIPIHKDLLRLGLNDYVNCVRKAGHSLLFPYLVKTRNRWSGRLLAEQT